MTETPPEPRWSLACRDVGFSCEWEIRGRPRAEVDDRFAMHAKCAHGVSDVGPDLAAKLAAVRRPS